MARHNIIDFSNLPRTLAEITGLIFTLVVVYLIFKTLGII